jgi:hypothetical protein
MRPPRQHLHVQPLARPAAQMAKKLLAQGDLPLAGRSESAMEPPQDLVMVRQSHLAQEQGCASLSP